MIKTYEIRNTVSAVHIFGLGKAKPFKAEFKGGRLDLERPVSATFSTPHFGQQLAIENSPLFGKVVFLKGQGAAALPAASPEPRGVEAVPEVTTVGAATNYLRERGAKASQMRNGKQVLAMAERMSISFPNLRVQDAEEREE